MRLIQALRYSQPESIAFVGAGGKTSALFQAAREIIQAPLGEGGAKTVLVTTSTHLGAWQAGQADFHRSMTSEQQCESLAQEIAGGVMLITGEQEGNLLQGLSPVFLSELNTFAKKRNLPLLIEADGAHTCPLKAPAGHEPAIPGFVDQVVVVAGLIGLGKPISEKTVHRQEQFAALAGIQSGDIISEESIVKVLLSPKGGLKNIPEQARRVVLLNQADTAGLQAQAKGMCDQLTSAYDACIIASLQKSSSDSSFIRHTDADFQNAIYAVVEPIGGIILAAGGSSRFGKPKQLLPWKGQPFIHHVILSALKAGLKPVIVVVGCFSTEVQSAIEDLPVRIVNNDKWKSGMSTSIKKGLSVLPGTGGGVIFLQADQPQITHTLIKSLVEAHQTRLSPIIAPLIDSQRGNPVLFDRCTFPELESLEGDVGGRALFSRYSIDWIPWQDKNMLIDIDSAEDYDKFLRLYPEGENPA